MNKFFKMFSKKANKDNITERPIFVFAASWRTGSTLMQRIINASKEAFIFGEPALVSNYRELYYKNKEYLERVAFNREKTDLNKRGQWIPVLNPSVENLKKSYNVLFKQLFSPKEIGLEIKRWGFKEVRSNAYENSKFLQELYPKAKFIYLIRNPYDMYVSLKGQKAIFDNFKDNDPYYPVRVWRENVNFFLDKDKIKEFDCLVIKYEDLINPNLSKEILQKICNFLNIKMSEDMLKELNMKAGSTKEKEPLSEQEINEINEIIQDVNVHLNYEYKKKNKVSVIIVTYNNLDLTKRCLYSVEKYSNYENLEVIIVDNNSQDGTKEYLKEYAKNRKNVKVILNEENLGFSAGNNIGIKNATGDYIVLLNNDTFVTPNWIERLMAHFELDNKIGLVGPRTNNIGNEAKIETDVKTEEEIVSFAEKLYKENRLKQYDKVRVLAFFCVMIKKEVFDKIGLLDEAFGIGMFEDDDFCERAKKAGYKLVCADDVFIYHHLSATFDKEPPEWKKKLFEKNKKIYESKHGKWIPHKYRR